MLKDVLSVTRPELESTDQLDHFFVDIPNLQFLDRFLPGIANDVHHPLFALLDNVVEVDVEAALRDAFAFEKRSFGQGVTAAEVIAVIQGVPGVVYVDLDALYIEDETHQGEPDADTVNAYLGAGRAHREGGMSKAAQLLLLNRIDFK